jgi:hypothetical protein
MRLHVHRALCRSFWVLQQCYPWIAFLMNRFQIIILVVVVLVFSYFNCKWVCTRWQWHYNKTQQTNNIHHTK